MNFKVSNRWNLILVPVLAVLAVLVVDPGRSTAQAQAKATLLTINDVYRIEGIDEGRDGGMARVRALRARLEETAPDLLMLHGGDFLSPSFLGRTYKGAQMIDLMNVMDGNPESGTHDPRLIATFGNHEFDDTHCSKDGPLNDLVARSEFTWLISNADFTGCEKLAPIAQQPNIKRTMIVESGGLRIGLYGLLLPRNKYAAIISDPFRASCEQIKALRAQKVDAVVALTHLNWRDDLKLLGIGDGFKPIPANDRSCDDQPDLVIGGHDHTSMALPSKSPRLFKADADALTAWVIEITKRQDGSLDIKGKLERLDESVAPDPLANRIAQMWTDRHDERFCLNVCLGKAKEERKSCQKKQVTGGECLRARLARTASEIETEEIVNRSSETGFGNWISDEVLKASGADVAILNAGAIRLNYTLKPGIEITRRHLEQMFPFRNKFVVREVTGGTLWKAVQHAINSRGEGAWLHYSGMAVRLGEKGKVTGIKVKASDGKTLNLAQDSKVPVRIVSLSFVMANGDKHGFQFCGAGKNVWACKSELEKNTGWPANRKATDLTDFLRDRLIELKSDLTLSKDKRLCDRGTKDCLIDRW